MRRCLTLADALHEYGFDVFFISNDRAVEIVPQLADYPVLSVETRPFEADILVVDHYDLDCAYEHCWRSFVKRILVVDDLANREHLCDFLLDQTYGRMADDYAFYVPDHCRLLLGPEYALLRPQFYQRREASLLRRQGVLENVLISFGSIDQYNLCPLALEALSDIDVPLQVNLVCEPDHAHLKQMKMLCDLMRHDVKFYHNVTDMADLMAAADLALGAGGSTNWERCTLGLPSIVYQVADNQSLILKNLAQEGAVWNMGTAQQATVKSLVQAVRGLLDDSKKLITCGARAARICEGRGTEKVARLLIEG